MRSESPLDHPLIKAVEAGHLPAIQASIDQMTQTMGAMYPALMVAIELQSLEAVRLLSSHFPSDQLASGPLDLAIDSNDIPLIEILLEQIGTDICSKQFNLLLAAIERRNLNLLSWFAEKGLKVANNPELIDAAAELVRLTRSSVPEDVSFGDASLPILLQYPAEDVVALEHARDLAETCSINPAHKVKAAIWLSQWFRRHDPHSQVGATTGKPPP
jgi:hypothetical protein